MDWDEFHSIVNGLIHDLVTYQKDNNITFDLISPILRSGAIPATIIASKLQITPMSPLQLKCEEEGVDVKFPPVIPLNINANEALNVLVVETNTDSGSSAALTLDLLKHAYPNSKFYYVSVCKVYGKPNVIEGYESYIYGIQTNETFDISEQEIKDNELRVGITIFPWETAKLELEEVNK